MSLWREGARQSAADTPQQRIASLPVSRCRRDTCNSCYFRHLRAAHPTAAEHPAPTNAVSFPPAPSGRSAPPSLVSSTGTASVVNVVSVAGCPSCSAARLQLERAQRSVQEATEAASVAAARLRVLETQLQSLQRLQLHQPPASSVNPDAISPAVPAVGQLDATHRCHAFFSYLQSGVLGRAADKAILWRIASTILLHMDCDEFRVMQKNGQGRVYARPISPRKGAVKKSQKNKRWAAARRLTLACEVGVSCEESGAVAVRRTAASHLSVREQVGLVYELGLSWTKFNKFRRALGGGRSGLTNRHELRKAKRVLAASPAKEVVVTSTGAHLANLALAVQERVTALCDADQFVERFVYGRDHKPMRATDARIPADLKPGAWGGCPPRSVPDVHISVGLDKGGDPASVKIVVSLINQDRPNNPSNTILAAVCPCRQDQYPQVAAMMAIHSPRVDELLARGVDVRGERRPVRLLLSGDFESQCTVVGHKGPNATMPCYVCKSTKAPSTTHTTLDERYGTLQDVSGPWHMRDADQYATCTEERANCGQDDHLSVTRPALVSPHPRQIVPIPVHLTIGINSRLLRLAVEVVIDCCGQAAASAFAYELAELLHAEARVHPVPYHGGVFIGRDCHAIGEHSDAVCSALEKKLSGLNEESAEIAARYPPAYKDAWCAWNRVRKVLNRATIATAAEAAAFRSDAAMFVAGLKHSFGWLNVSPKLHFLLAHAPDFLDEFGSIGLYGEQGLEAWHGRFGQTAPLYPGETDLASAAAFVRVMALAGDASPAALDRLNPKRASAAEGAHKATKAADKRLRGNKPALPVCDETREKVKHERELWADKVLAVSAQTMTTYEGRLGKQSG